MLRPHHMSILLFFNGINLVHNDTQCQYVGKRSKMLFELKSQFSSWIHVNTLFINTAILM